MVGRQELMRVLARGVWVLGWRARASRCSLKKRAVGFSVSIARTAKEKAFHGLCGSVTVIRAWMEKDLIQRTGRGFSRKAGFSCYSWADWIRDARGAPGTRNVLNAGEVGARLQVNKGTNTDHLLALSQVFGKFILPGSERENLFECKRVAVAQILEEVLKPVHRRSGSFQTLAKGDVILSAWESEWVKVGSAKQT
jgi:hypothetical protein